MGTRSEYISIIRSFSDVIKSQFGVTSLRLFGSVAREEHTENSDIDVCCNETQHDTENAVETFFGEASWL